MNELGEYVTDVDTELAKKSIETLGLILIFFFKFFATFSFFKLNHIGNIALKVELMAVPITKQLSTFIGMQREYITNVTMVAF